MLQSMGSQRVRHDRATEQQKIYSSLGETTSVISPSWDCISCVLGLHTPSFNQLDHPVSSEYLLCPRACSRNVSPRSYIT